MTDRWFILRVQGRRLAAITARIGPDLCWSPSTPVWTKPARKHKPILVHKPLIPGWLFVRESQYGLWNDLEGVYGVLKYGRLGPIFVDDASLDGLRSACDSPEGQPQGEVDQIPVGTPVKLRGLLYGRSGTLTRYTRDGYAVIDLGPNEVQVMPRLVERATH